MQLIAAFISAVLLAAILYLFTPTVAWGFTSILVATAAALLPFFITYDLTRPGRGKSRSLPVSALYAGAALAFILIVPWSLSTPLLRSDAYYRLLGPVPTPEGNFSADLPPIDVHNAPLVSEPMAEQVAQKKLSVIPGMGSTFELGPFAKQKIGEKLYWVTFLQYRGFFQWVGSAGTPGYIRVSATNPEEVALVTEYQGRPLRMRYVDSAYFNESAYRHIYLSGLMNRGITDLTPEVDDSGRPYITATLYDKTIGFSGANATGVALLDVQTGDVKTYDIAHVPAWVDRVQPADFVEEQISDRGRFVHGYWNLNNKDKLKPSGELDIVYGSDGRCYYYSGLTSIGNDNGITGFMLVDSRTKAVKSYRLPGANEEIAQKAAEGAIHEKNYRATDPLPFVINGQPTYLMTLTDSTGIPRDYGMVLIRDGQTVAVDTTLESTLRQYTSKLPGASGFDVNTAVKQVPLTGTVDRISSEVRQGKTIYYITLTEARRHIFTASSDLSEKLVLTKPGDKVKLNYAEGPAVDASMTAFDNLSIPLR